MWAGEGCRPAEASPSAQACVACSNSHTGEAIVHLQSGRCGDTGAASGRQGGLRLRRGGGAGIDAIQLRACSTTGGMPSTGQCNAGVVAVLNVVAGAMPRTPLEVLLAWVPGPCTDASFLRPPALRRLLEPNLIHLSGRFSNLVRRQNGLGFRAAHPARRGAAPAARHLAWTRFSPSRFFAFSPSRSFAQPLSLLLSFSLFRLLAFRLLVVSPGAADLHPDVPEMCPLPSTHLACLLRSLPAQPSSGSSPAAPPRMSAAGDCLQRCFKTLHAIAFWFHSFSNHLLAGFFSAMPAGDGWVYWEPIQRGYSPLVRGTPGGRCTREGPPGVWPGRAMYHAEAAFLRWQMGFLRMAPLPLQDLSALGSLRSLRQLHISALDLASSDVWADTCALPALEHLELFGIWLLPRLVAACALPALRSLSVWSAGAGAALNCISALTTLQRYGCNLPPSTASAP